MARNPRPDPSPTTPDPIEIAMEADAGDTRPDSPARRVLLKQEGLIDEQVKLIRTQRRSESLGAVLKRLTILAVAVAIVAAGAMAWSASRARGLVIDAFSVPPALAERGMTGEVLARQLTDDLAAISTIAQSAEQQRSVTGNWGASLSIEIPETGVSLSQIDQWLRAKLSHQTHVSGEMISAEDGSIRLVSRTGSLQMPPAVGHEADVPAMLQKAAEAIYRHEQPRSYGPYLINQKRLDEEMAWSRERLTWPSANDRARGWVGLETVVRAREGDLATLEYDRRALATDPTYRSAYGNLAGTEENLGHPEAAYQLYRQAVELFRKRGDVTEQARQVQFEVFQQHVADSLGDAATGRALNAKLANQVLLGFTGRNVSVSLISVDYANLHDIFAAVRQRNDYAASNPGDRYSLASSDLSIKRATSDWEGAIAAADAGLAFNATLPDKGRDRPGFTTSKALALAHLGRFAEAQALIGPTALDCQPCVSARGEIAALAGDARTSEHWFGEAVRMAPSLPQANEAWGRMLLQRGEADRAIVQFAEAVRKSPRYADPIAEWGEALLAKGDAKGAAKKFEAAARLAPNWGRLHLKWGEALAREGHRDKAREQWEKAGRLFLTPEEHTRLATNLGSKP